MDIVKEYLANKKTGKYKGPFHKILRKMGLVLYRYKGGHVYCPEELVLKALKSLDIENVSPFSETAREVIENKKTRLEYDRLYMIYQAMCNVSRLGNGNESLAEVGVYKGGCTYFMASLAERIFKTQRRIHGFDTFTGHDAEDITSGLDEPHRPGKFSDTSFIEVQQYVSGFPEVILHKGRFQDRKVDIAGEPFCFAHIDVDIYAATKDALDFFSHALVHGGIILVDDYGFMTCEGAKQAVDEFVETRSDFIKFHLETGQCLLIRWR
jgi:hypothetical protein